MENNNIYNNISKNSTLGKMNCWIEQCFHIWWQAAAKASTHTKLSVWIFIPLLLVTHVRTNFCDFHLMWKWELLNETFIPSTLSLQCMIQLMNSFCSLWKKKAVTNLSGSLRLDEVFVDLLSLGSHFHRVLGLLEVLAGHPELNILITELRLQEAAESRQSIWWREGKGSVKSKC